MMIEITPEGIEAIDPIVKYSQIRISNMSDNVLIQFLNKKNHVVGKISIGYVGPNQDITINGIKGKLDVVVFKN